MKTGKFDAFWAEVSKRLAPGEKLSKIKDLYEKGILSYADLVSLPVLKASEIRRKHKEELERQAVEAEKRKIEQYEKSIKDSIRIDGDRRFVLTDRAGIIVAFGGPGEEITASWIGPEWSPKRELERLRSEDRILYELLRRRLPGYERAFNEIEKGV